MKSGGVKADELDLRSANRTQQGIVDKWFPSALPIEKALFDRYHVPDLVQGGGTDALDLQ